MEAVKKKTVYLIGGTMGVGKTTVCRQLQRDLPNSVFLDGDWCWDANPFQVTQETKEMVLDNICYVLNRFIRCSAYDNIIFCWVMHLQQTIDTILGRLDTADCRVVAVSLLAEETALRERLMKDVAGGLRTEDILERSIERIPLYHKLNTVKIDTTSKSIQMIAGEIAAWRGRENT